MRPKRPGGAREGRPAQGHGDQVDHSGHGHDSLRSLELCSLRLRVRYDLRVEPETVPVPSGPDGTMTQAPHLPGHSTTRRPVRRAISRNTVFAVAVSILGSIGLLSYVHEKSLFSAIVTSFLLFFIYAWCLRIPASLLELYLGKCGRRLWIYLPHCLAAGIVVVAAAGNSGSPRNAGVYRNAWSLQAVTFYFIAYLMCALVLLVLSAVTLSVLRKTRKDASPASTGAPNGSHRRPEERIWGHLGLKSVPGLQHGPPSRDAAVFALSLMTAIAGTVQAVDLHDPGKTIFALVIGGISVYVISKLPTAGNRTDRHEGSSNEQSRTGNESSSSS
jgi:hypothetical protein